MAGRTLTNSVYLRNPDGLMTCLEAGTELPDWAKGKVGAHAFRTEDGDGGDTVDLPPRSGKGSGIGAWAQYADANGVEYADDASRDDIIAALDEAGVPTGADETE